MQRFFIFQSLSTPLNSDSASAASGRITTVKQRAAYRRARACPSPCLGRNGETVLASERFSRRSSDRGGQAPALRGKQRAAARRNGETVLASERVSRRSNAHGGQAPALRGKQRATARRNGETVLASERVSRRSNARGGQAPALR